ncbi:MOSC domain-containing protein [Streptomyces sp. NPDC086777]|uniref:MOSC domain-containing protein n=1 Tax=Streptomyces sp. NPDC086777 TaxID=3154866 RepID=UPI00344FF833
MFGENFTVDGLPDDEVCIGDRYRVGEAEFEVTQPRVTCYRVGMRLGEPAMAMSTSTAPRRHRRPATTGSPGAARPSPRSPRWVCPPTPTPTSAGRPPS